MAWLLLAVLVGSVVLTIRKSSSTNGASHIPLINPRKFYDIGGIWAKIDFILHARRLLALGVSSGRPFRLLTDLGEMIVLPACFASEIRSDPRLSFAEVIEQNFHSRFPGFEGFRMGTTDAHLSRDIANNQLTHTLAKVTQALSDECAAALSDHFPAAEEWSDICLREHVLQLVARLSSRVFLGDEGANNGAWLRITTEYTKTAYIAAYMLRLWPPFLRPFAHWFIPHCRKLRSQVAEARRIIAGVIERRRESIAAAKLAGQQVPQYNDAIEWFEQDVAKQDGRHDPVVAQLILAQAAIETTTDLLTQVILNLSQHPELTGPLREEATKIIREGGWRKSSLYGMKLLDSVLKESQRLKPLAMTSMHRLVLEDITLSDGTRLPKGSVIGVSADRMWDPNVHENPTQFDGFRFQRMRDHPGGTATQAHLVSTSVNHLAFGHGKHACAGRFFVAHETKIALTHLLLKYDWKIASYSIDARPMEFGLVLQANPKAKISIRARQPDSEGPIRA
ncbi:hypothetical protein CNMCM5793_001849 [Aspergillus hiratsukae]|uniref:Cytochrome P450 n=1 Tax=Aspergillus hiratsukae TaxID=1194566 RepID=A0A8H6PCG4_9EURO|nr:hypothetical protein CNMCM5793_001849 [Aspergillus hiratsukae]